MMNGISIELATATHAPECAVVLRASRRHSLPYLPDLHTPTENLDFLTNQVFANDTVFVAVEESGKVVGFVAFRKKWVDHLYLLPNYQRQGVGSRLLQEAKRAWPTLNLWTFERNSAARRFYEKHGFRIVKCTDGAENEEREPDILYRWTR